MFHPANPGDAHPQKNKEVKKKTRNYISFFYQNLICPFYTFLYKLSCHLICN